MNRIMQHSIWQNHLSLRMSVFSLCAFLLVVNSEAAPDQLHLPKYPPKMDQEFFPESLPDPYEPLNRGVFEVNQALLLGVIEPSSKAYRMVMPKAARTSIQNFTRNITYPGRLLSHSLQGRWDGAKVESLRFLTNSTLGIGGLFDVATVMHQPKAEAHFAQVLDKWGWQPHFYMMLPLLGPSDDSHVAGSVVDRMAEPWNYSTPYIYGSYASSYNQIAISSPAAAQFMRSEADPYFGLKYLWTYSSKESSPDWSITSAPDIPTLETLRVASIRCKDPNFIYKKRDIKVRLSSTKRKMTCSYWLQPKHAPLVYIVPGLGSHRLNTMCLALAEEIYQAGYSVVTTTGLFHPEFMESASTSVLPAYPPYDSKDILTELTEFDQALQKRHPKAFGQRALVGLSMGGYQALYLAAREKTQDPTQIHFERYIAINPPVNLRYGIQAIDKFRKAPLVWLAETRQERINNSIHKLAKIQSAPSSTKGKPLMDAEESKFLIGTSFELTLQDCIFSSQKRHNLGVLEQPISSWRRDATYREISKYSFKDYFLRFVVPYYKTRGIGLDDFSREINLRNYSQAIRANDKIRVITNRNDFLLESSDVKWLKSNVSSPHLCLFENGGHLGNLTDPASQVALSKALGGLH